MDGVAAEVAEEVGVLFKNDDGDAGTRQEHPSIMPAGPPPATTHCTCMVAVYRH
jgi:hypothetical protein